MFEVIAVTSLLTASVPPARSSLLADRLSRFVGDISFVSTAIFYEHLCTLAHEVRFIIWGRERTGAMAIFVFNRHIVFAFGVIALLRVFSWDTNLVHSFVFSACIYE